MRRRSLNIGYWAIRSHVGRYLLGTHMQLSYSQEGEDRVLARMLEGRGPGFYVDVGAHDPVRFSNTYLLYSSGWRGIAIDPLISSRERFRRLRPRDIVLTVAVGQQPGEQVYFEFDEPALNTLSQERAEILTQTTPFRLVGTRPIDVERLDTLIAQHLPEGVAVDVLNVDVEGNDEDVLRSNDWARFRPSIVIAEELGATSLNAATSGSVTRYLASQDYIPFAKAVNSLIFIDEAASGTRSE